MDVFTNYLKYTEHTESPVVYHRWCFLVSVGAALGRRAFFTHGHWKVYPNLYAMLMGEPATRKSSAVKLARKLFASSGYPNFAADKTTKEKFLLDLEGIIDDTHLESGGKPKYDAVTSENIWGSNYEGEPKEVFISADEFNEFAGAGNMDFYTTLGNLWDWDSDTPFRQRLKNSRSVSIYQPTVSLLAGNTPELFARAFPPETIGSGFLSRLILIHGESSGRRIAFPPPPDKELGDGLLKYFKSLLDYSPGELKVSAPGIEILTEIYNFRTSHINDLRFKAYAQRSFTHLLKICVILTAAKFSSIIDTETIILANTILGASELQMPKAMGEFGKSKNSDIANKIMVMLEKSMLPVTYKAIWKEVSRDLGKPQELHDLMRGLTEANRIQFVEAKPYSGFLPKKDIRRDPIHVDWSLLTQEERDML